jgi:hypothetical protein
MKRAILLIALAAACGGSTPHSQVAEVPIEQSGRSGEGLPPDEVGGDSGATSTTFPDGSAPPGVGPQSLDTTPDAGASQATPAAFVQRTGGLTQKECTDVVVTFAKQMTKENHAPATTAADVATHAVYGPMLIECGQTTTKKQQKCAMAAKTSAAWKKCME